MLFGFGKRRQGFLKKLKELKMEIYQCLGLTKVEDEKKDAIKFKEKVSTILKLVCIEFITKIDRWFEN